MKFEKLTIEDGLSQSTVKSIYQDHWGFLWFGTADGLNRYDGYNFTVYKPNADDPFSISYNIILDIYEDKEGYLWIATDGGGLNQFDRKSEKFCHFLHEDNNPQSIGNNHIYSLLEDRKGQLWIGTVAGPNILDKKTGTFIRFNDSPNVPPVLCESTIIVMLQDKSGALWFATDPNGLFRLENPDKPISEYKFKQYLNEPGNPSSLPSDSVYHVARDRADNIWICTEKGLCLYQADTDDFKVYRHEPDNPGSLGNDCVIYTYEDSRDNFWIATNGGGLNRLEKEKQQFIHYQMIPGDPASLSDNYVKCIFEDRSGILWFGTNISGIAKYNWRKHQIKQYAQVADSNTDQGLSDNCIWSLCEDRNETLWVGTRKGLTKIDKKNNRYTHFTNIPDNPSSLSQDCIQSILEDRQGRLWIGTGYGLNLYDQKNNQFVRYIYDPKDSNTVGHNRILKIFEDRDGILWLGTKWGLKRFDPGTGVFTDYFIDPDNPGLNFIYAIYQDSRNDLWTGTYDGLGRFNIKSGKFIIYKNNPGDPFSLSHNTVFCIYEDKKERLWICTWGGGLNRYDREKDQFIHYDEKNGLANNSVYGLLEDTPGNLWLSTNKGLSRFNPDTLTFKNYSRADGLTSDEFNLGAFYKNGNGRMYFGSVDGFVSFYPDNLNDDPVPPPVVLTDFQVFNHSVPVNGNSFLKSSIYTAEKIYLSYKESVFSFSFSALHFSAPERNLYAYQLAGFDKEWVMAGKRRYVTYTNLPAGDYTFKVKAANKDGIWNRQGAAVKLSITPPLWRTWWAYLFYILIAFALIYAYIRFRLSRQAELYEQQYKAAEIEHLKEANSRMSIFFINLAHEIKTPLTLIINYLDSHLKKNKFTDELRIVRQNIHKITNDIVNFMDSEKLKTGQIFYDHSRISNLSAITAQKVLLFKSIAEKKTITIESDIEEEIYLKADPLAADRVLNNLLDNAIKYNILHGKIMVTLKAIDKAEQKYLELQVSDTGIGIPQEYRKNIFLPYYQISHPKRNIQGMGMGLNIVKQIMESLQGDIELTSEPGKGTCIKLSMARHILTADDELSREADPVLPVEETISPEPAEEQYKEGRFTIFIVEDNRELLVYLQQMKELYNVFVATSGEEALEKIQRIPKPQLIISDIMMDKMDGYEFYDNLIKNDEYNHIAFIFLTAKTSLEEAIKGLAKGAVDYISKPFLIDVLLLKVAALLKQQEAQKKNQLKSIEKRISQVLETGQDVNSVFRKFNELCSQFKITDREKDLILNLLQGLENKEIAEHLNMSTNTVKTHIKNIYKKCNVQNRVELVNLFKS